MLTIIQELPRKRLRREGGTGEEEERGPRAPSLPPTPTERRRKDRQQQLLWRRLLQGLETRGVSLQISSVVPSKGWSLISSPRGSDRYGYV